MEVGHGGDAKFYHLKIITATSVGSAVSANAAFQPGEHLSPT